MNVFVISVQNEYERKSNMQIQNAFYEIFVLVF